MEYVIYKGTPKKYILSTSIPLTYTGEADKAFGFASEQAAESFLTFLKNQGISTNGFHLGQKPPK